MAFPFLPSIDFQSYAKPSQGLDGQALSHIGAVFSTATPANIDDAFVYLRETFGVFATHLDVSGLDQVCDVVSLLDAGAAKVFVSLQQLQQLRSVPNLDLDRLVVGFQGSSKQEFIDAIGGTSVGVYVQDVQDVELELDYLNEYGTDRPAVFTSFARPVLESALAVAKLSGTPILPATLLTIDPVANASLIPVGKLLLANATSDRPDGLFTTLVTDERGIALGLVYSSEESVQESLRTGRGVYQSRRRGLWRKGESSGDVQELVRVSLDCDSDCLNFVVRQKGRGFCHLATATCFGNYRGLSRLQQILTSRKSSAPEGSYTARLFNDARLLKAKIMEEAQELVDAKTKDQIAFEAADLFYFALTKCIAAGVSLEEVERSLDQKSVKIKRRKGDAKGAFAKSFGVVNGETNGTVNEVAAEPKSMDRIQMQRIVTAECTPDEVAKALQRPSQRSAETIIGIVNPIVQSIRERGDAALLEYTHKFEKATSLTTPVLKAPFPQSMMQLPPETIAAIDTSFENIRKFHAAQADDKPLEVETMPGVQCRRFVRPIERVGLYVPGGTAVLPSTALMLGVPAMVAGCQKIVMASPPRADGTVSPEIVYCAAKVGAESIVLAGGAQAVAAMAYGTESVAKVDKILGPGNQFVTAAKMLVSTDTRAGVSIDMPAGPSEVLVVADASANPAFVASDLLSQAEHGVDSQVILIAVNLGEHELLAIEDELHRQALDLPRVDIVRGAIEHSVTFVVADIHEAMALSNMYAPEHLILQVRDVERVAQMVNNAGSVFMGPWTPESVGDYSAGVNHSLPTYGYAKQYSGVNLGSYVKHITASKLTADGLRNVGPAVMQLARVEQLEAHRRAVDIRLAHMDAVPTPMDHDSC